MIIHTHQVPVDYGRWIEITRIEDGQNVTSLAVALDTFQAEVQLIVLDEQGSSVTDPETGQDKTEWIGPVRVEIKADAPPGPREWWLAALKDWQRPVS